jgi:hypothetical protein
MAVLHDGSFELLSCEESIGNMWIGLLWTGGMYLNEGMGVAHRLLMMLFSLKQCGGKKLGIIARRMGPILGKFPIVMRLRTFEESTSCEYLRIVLTISTSALF